jgi:hypothetical protein
MLILFIPTKSYCEKYAYTNLLFLSCAQNYPARSINKFLIGQQIEQLRIYFFYPYCKAILTCFGVAETVFPRQGIHK